MSVRGMLTILAAGVLVCGVSPVLAQSAASKSKAAPAKPAAAAKPEAKPEARPAAGSAEPTLIVQFGTWGAYTATPNGKKVCFALAKPA